MTLFNKKHFLWTFVLFEYIVHLSKRNKRILLRGNKNSWNILNQLKILEIDLINIKICLILHNRLQIFQSDLQDKLG